jgi:hypothetical protein
VSSSRFAADCAVFVFSYNRIATPFLAEAQRDANAEFIMTVTAGAFSAVALFTGAAMFCSSAIGSHSTDGASGWLS